MIGSDTPRAQAAILICNLDNADVGPGDKAETKRTVNAGFSES
jgi:hypothetical protein